MSEPAGIQWCARYPSSNLLTDLAQPFQQGVTSFIAALRSAGAAVTVNATYRPPERAYLMHFACMVAGYTDAAKVFHQIKPGDVPAYQGVDIDWTCGGDMDEARIAAAEMVQAYQIVYPAALVSNHTRRLAVDMDIGWRGTMAIVRKGGAVISVDSRHPEQLWPVGASYGVIKLPTDKPHWSADGH